MSYHQTGPSNWLTTACSAASDEPISCPIIFKLGSFALGQTSIGLKFVDVGHTAISGDELDAQSLRPGHPYFLKCVPDHVSLDWLFADRSMFVYRGMHGRPPKWGQPNSPLIDVPYMLAACFHVGSTRTCFIRLFWLITHGRRSWYGHYT